MIKKLISVFFIFLLSIFQVIGYAYDVFFKSYSIDASANHTSVVYLISSQKSQLHSFSNTYHFSDGSQTIVSIHGLNTTKEKIDFITNGKGMFIENLHTDLLKPSIKAANKDMTPKQLLLVTGGILGKKSFKEKSIESNDILSLSLNSYIEQKIIVNKVSYAKKVHFSYSLRGPPYIISLTLV